MNLSPVAIQDLKATLIKEYGSFFGLSDNELEEIGLFLLTAVAEDLKIRSRKTC
jgi:hypothetical protein